MPNNYVIVDGKRFISEDLLIGKLVEACDDVATYGDDVYVAESEGDRVYTFEEFLKKLPLSCTLEFFRKEYVKKRFMKRVGL